MSAVHLALVPRRESVPRARHWARARAEEAGLVSGVAAVVELLTSEVVANAVVHGTGAIELAITVGPRSFTVAVTDDGDMLPVVRTSGPEVPGGQGLRLVERLADQWGVERRRGGGKTVWFTVSGDGDGDGDGDL